MRRADHFRASHHLLSSNSTWADMHRRSGSNTGRTAVRKTRGRRTAEHNKVVRNIRRSSHLETVPRQKLHLSGSEIHWQQPMQTTFF